jgi:CHAD domain-containing protein
MSYRIEQPRPLGDEVRRIIGEQIDSALATIDDDTDLHETVHEVRKRCKKIRAVLRLVRPALGDAYARENARYRDAARLVAPLRDATANVETHDALVAHFDREVDHGAMAALRTWLLARRQALIQERPDEERLAEVKQALAEGRAALEELSLRRDGFGAVGAGLARTYARARRGLRRVCREPRPEFFHEWRKRAKYHRYHVRLLRGLWPEGLACRRQELHVLTDYLGDEHDLTVLRGVLVGEGALQDLGATAQFALALIDRRRVQLQAAAVGRGRRLHADKKKALVGRVRAYWKVWADEHAADPDTAARQAAGEDASR